MRRRRKQRARKRLALLTCILLTVSMAGSVSFADQTATGSAVLTVSGPGVEVQMQGSITPTILSVTMPSNVAFEINKGGDSDNKVLSPDVNVINGSDIPVSIYVEDTYVDVSGLSGTTYVPSVSGGSIAVTGGGIYVPNIGFMTSGAIQVETTEMAIGLSDEWTPTGGAVMPGLAQARWLIEGNLEPTYITSIEARGSRALHVVGVIGKGVPENRNFTVTPTLIAMPGRL